MQIRKITSILGLLSRRFSKKISIGVILVIYSWSSFADTSLLPDRRRSQFRAESGHAIFPFPYSLPGIGNGISVIGGMSNITDTYIDAYGLLFTGDVKGVAGSVSDLHLVSKRLILDIGGGRINKVAFTRYGQRGMDSKKDDYSILELSDARFNGGRLTATFFNRRFEFYGALYNFKSRLDRIRDRDGNIIIESEDPSREGGDRTILGIRVDLTDDYHDPRTGINLDISGWHHQKVDIGPEYDIIDISITGYIPFGLRNTWAFNFFRSDAHVSQQGEIDEEKVEESLGFDCDSIADPEQKNFCSQQIDNVIANNRYGTASSLGGFNRLRSYPGGRFSGAHTQFFGTEFRWNLTDEFTPFNLYVLKDIRTAIQISFFYEIGSTSDHRSDLNDTMRSSYGGGFRMVTASGIVFRADLAYGHEGLQPSIFLGYPWDI